MITTLTQSSAVDQALLDAMNPKRTGKGSTQDAQDKFLTLLVTQMKNQDPLNPMDNAQVTSQMAQLSTVSGIEKLNTAVAALNANFQSSQNLQAAGMIGRNVLVPGDGVILSKGNGVLAIDLPQASDTTTVTILDEKGVVVRKIELGAQVQGMNNVKWDGKTDAGATAPDGNYRFEVAARAGDKVLDVTKLGLGPVTSISSTAQGMKLNIANLGQVNIGDVRLIF